jgi:type IV secretion system protein VirB2
MSSVRRFGQSATITIALNVLAAPAFAALPADPQGSGILINASTWLQGTLLGTAASVAAVLSV